MTIAQQIEEEEITLSRLREEYQSDRPEAEKSAILDLIADRKIVLFKLKCQQELALGEEL
jgi:hypothetical protein